MFTWNFQYISKARLAETIGQLMLDRHKGGILIRIHTAIHTEEEAVDLARFIKNIVPSARILGTSTAAPLIGGMLVPNQCVISVTKLTGAAIRSAMLSLSATEEARAMADRDTEFLFAFFAGAHEEVRHITQHADEFFPGIPMMGGIVNLPEETYRRYRTKGFIFDETGWLDRGMLLTALTGEDMECIGGFATGAQETEGNAAMAGDLPEMIHYTDDGKRILMNPQVSSADKVRMAFCYDGKIIAEDRMLFGRIENFPKAETVLGYTCLKRVKLYPHSVNWELSAYENSNLCGCVLNGLVAWEDGMNLETDCAFSVMAVGEAEYTQKYNPYVFAHTDTLSEDNRTLMSYLMDIEKKCEAGEEETVNENIRLFARDCESELLHAPGEEIPGGAALSMDLRVRGYDRICMIDVPDVSRMRAVFPDNVVEMTKKKYLEKSASFAKKKNYHIYLIEKWQIGIGAASYMVRLSDFIRDMEELQRELFRASEETVAIVPTFCILDGCDPESLWEDYYAARNKMSRKNLQFDVYDADVSTPDEESIRASYRMVDVINYAIANDRVIPYYQGIYDNHMKKISHYEALMRIEDETGKICYPGEFLDVARSYGLLYDTLSRTMIAKVFEKFKGYTGLSVSLNLGMRDIKNRELVEFICDFLTTADHPENFVFEILENEDVDDYESILDFVDRVHHLGGRISIDDFGSGYSNLLHIVSIHSDYIKIDGSIVRKCDVDPESENIIALISGWRNLSARSIGIIAEYVENEEIQKKLESYNIDFSQGYLFSKPSPDVEEE